MASATMVALSEYLRSSYEPDAEFVEGRIEERVVRTAPLVCIEILSPEDTMSRTMVRVREFLAMGVREVWVFDPEARVAQVCGGTTMTEHAGGMLRVPGTPCEVSLDQVFSALPRR